MKLRQLFHSCAIGDEVTGLIALRSINPKPLVESGVLALGTKETTGGFPASVKHPVYRLQAKPWEAGEATTQDALLLAVESIVGEVAC